MVDPDSKGNQCPCTFTITDDPSGSFDIEVLPPGDRAVVKSKRGVVFDREAKGKLFLCSQHALTREREFERGFLHRDNDHFGNCFHFYFSQIQRMPPGRIFFIYTEMAGFTFL